MEARLIATGAGDGASSTSPRPYSRPVRRSVSLVPRADARDDRVDIAFYQGGAVGSSIGNEPRSKRAQRTVKVQTSVSCCQRALIGCAAGTQMPQCLRLAILSAIFAYRDVWLSPTLCSQDTYACHRDGWTLLTCAVGEDLIKAPEECWSLLHFPMTRCLGTTRCRHSSAPGCDAATMFGSLSVVLPDVTFFGCFGSFVSVQRGSSSILEFCYTPEISEMRLPAKP